MAETRTSSVLVIRTDHTEYSCANAMVRRTKDERLVLMGRDGRPFHEFTAAEWREVSVYRDGSLFARELNRTLPSPASSTVVR